MNQKMPYRVIPILLIVFSTLFSLSCKKYLDEQSDKKLQVPSTYKDLQSLLDAGWVMNESDPPLLIIAADDVFVTDNVWSSLMSEETKNYTWDKDAEMSNNWAYGYGVILYANFVLDNFPKISDPKTGKEQINNIEGSALFFRATNYFNLCQLYCKPWNEQSAATDPGIPLKQSSDINEPVTRATVKECYDKILGDLKQAANLLPDRPLVKTRPSKGAAYGLLSRAYMTMRDYSKAELYADSALQYNNTLIDYNTVDYTGNPSFQKFNDEVVFHSYASSSQISYYGEIDSNLIKSYSDNDLRKEVFFNDMGDGTFSFKGAYDGVGWGVSFNGVATDEMYLNKAECLARRGEATSSMNVLNSLLEKRWLTGTFIPLSAVNAKEALRKILSERRKELVFRGTRWSDLRRLNQEDEFAITLKRTIQGKLYTLPPNDLRYTMLIPQEIISLTGISQNPR